MIKNLSRLFCIFALTTTECFSSQSSVVINQISHLSGSAKLDSQGDFQTIRDQQPDLVIDAEFNAKFVTDQSQTRVIGQCVLVSNPPGTSLSPTMAAKIYFKWFEKKEIGVDGKIALLDEPLHGKILSDATGRWAYVPAKKYQGMDRATFQVQIAGYKVKLIYGFNVMPYVGGGTEGYDPLQDPELCPNGQFWKIFPDGKVVPLKRSGLHPINTRV